MSFVFPTVDEVRQGQLQHLLLYGGGEPGVLDESRLDSAVHQPQQTGFGQFLLSDVYEMGAGYLKYLVLGHCFANGNKRVALGTALEFLHLNGVRVMAETQDLYQLVIDVIEHKCDIALTAEFFKNNSEPGIPLSPDADPITRARELDTVREWMHAQYADVFELLAQ